MIPSAITRGDIRKATKEIDRSGVPPRRESYRYDILIRERRYPPKLAVSKAAKRVLGEELSHRSFNAVEAKNFLIRRGFVIIEKASAGERFVGATVAEEHSDESYAEGESHYRQHRIYERDSRIAKKAKSLRLKEVGELRCDVCDFSFADTYGPLGYDYIEAHHIVPVSRLGEKASTALRDIALVCANCHRILHRAKPMLSIASLREIVRKNSGQREHS